MDIKENHKTNTGSLQTEYLVRILQKYSWDRRVAWSILPARGAGDSSSNLDGPTFHFFTDVITSGVPNAQEVGPWGSLVDPSGFGSPKLQFKSGRSHFVEFSIDCIVLSMSKIVVGPWGSLVDPSGFGSPKLQFKSGRSHYTLLRGDVS